MAAIRRGLVFFGVLFAFIFGVAYAKAAVPDNPSFLNDARMQVMVGNVSPAYLRAQVCDHAMSGLRWAFTASTNDEAIQRMTPLFASVQDAPPTKQGQRALLKEAKAIWPWFEDKLLLRAILAIREAQKACTFYYTEPQQAEKQ